MHGHTGRSVFDEDLAGFCEMGMHLAGALTFYIIWGEVQCDLTLEIISAISKRIQDVVKLE